MPEPMMEAEKTTGEVLRLYGSEECGRDGYPLEWHRSIKHLVREQAGYRCIRCQHPYRNGEHGKGEWSPCDIDCRHGGPFQEMPPGYGGQTYARWRILTVHHLDGDKRNCRWWNLVALCQRDHLRVQTRVHMEQVWPWKHSEWFRPYAAGYYAWTYLGEDLGRIEVERRMGELLMLGAP